VGYSVLASDLSPGRNGPGWAVEAYFNGFEYLITIAVFRERNRAELLAGIVRISGDFDEGTIIVKELST
jgi:hypothetical protein